LAGGVLIIAFATLAAIFGMQGEIVLVLLAVPVIGALLGFLIHNFNPASVFMGDSGSLVLGYMVAAYSLQAPVHADPFIAILVPAVALGVPLVDTGLSVLRRFLERKAVCAPDHDHVHHRLTRRWPVRRSVLILYGASLWFAAAAFVMSQMMAFQGMMVLALTAVASIMGLRALGYLHIRESLDVWRAVRIEAQIEESDAEIPSSRRVSKLHPLLIQRVEDDQAHYERRPKVNIRDDSSSGDSQASAA
ncbi:MAG: MraY family glycosyltransferase, partial [Rhodothermales bacterium]